MALIGQFSERGWGNCLLWQIDEPEKYFLHYLDQFAPHFPSGFEAWQPRRRKEWLAGRYLLTHTLNCTLADVVTDDYGKPHLAQRGIEISLSHTAKWVALLYHEAPVGLDIQKFRGDITHLQDKFSVPHDLELVKKSFSEAWRAYVIWSAKEAMYKAFGRRRLDFRRHILLQELDEHDGAVTFQGVISRERYTVLYDVHVMLFQDLVIARAITRQG